MRDFRRIGLGKFANVCKCRISYKLTSYTLNNQYFEKALAHEVCVKHVVMEIETPYFYSEDYENFENLPAQRGCC